MKKYVKPTMNGELFMTNEYISACFIGECNIDGSVYSDPEGKNRLYTNDACGHEFTIRNVETAPAANAYVVGGYRVCQWVDKDNWIGNGTHKELECTWKTETTPVYLFERVHVATISSIKPHAKPNHS